MDAVCERTMNDFGEVETRGIAESSGLDLRK
jgi:hypothetical protein